MNLAHGTHRLVVIDDREARIYKAELHGSGPPQVAPTAPDGSGRYLHQICGDFERQRKPERKGFYQAVARSLAGAARVLVFGSDAGASSAMGQLLAQLNRHHADVARHIVGSAVLDDPRMTEDQLLARAREVYASIAV